MRVAKQDYANLAKVFETAKKELAKCPADGADPIPGGGATASAASGSAAPDLPEVSA